ncbi:MAG: aminopeptidase P N-terminal domain-containing protein, partial [Myxococcota bacterium]|nr:aminopeptidase P N-terminal domain-containing protein [Myxococcota bacterium]
MATYAERRARLLERLGSDLLVVAAAPVALRNASVEHPWRQDSDLHYLTGLVEPESVLLLGGKHPEHRAVVFVRPRDEERERWDGERLGVERAAAALGVDAAFPIGELAKRLPDYMADVRRVHYRLGRVPAMDALLLEAIDRVRSRERLGVSAPVEIVDPRLTVHELRMRKDPEEVEAMRRAVAVSIDAHLSAMAVAAPGRYEYELEAEILRTFRAAGAERPAYPPIVGSGPNATVLHHRRNDRRIEAGELVLVDAGCEF